MLRTTKIGLYLGYPQCCIDDFTNENGELIFYFMRSDEVKKASANGYIPCQKCAEKINNNEVTREELINTENRKCSIPFTSIPNDDDDEKIHLEIEKNF